MGRSHGHKLLHSRKEFTSELRKEFKAQVLELRRDGLEVWKIASNLGISYSTVSRFLRQAKIEQQEKLEGEQMAKKTCIQCGNVYVDNSARNDKVCCGPHCYAKFASQQRHTPKKETELMTQPATLPAKPVNGLVHAVQGLVGLNESPTDITAVLDAQDPTDMALYLEARTREANACRAFSEAAEDMAELQERLKKTRQEWDLAKVDLAEARRAFSLK